MLSLSPKFQRREVWKIGARSFLVDSLLRGMPVPPIYLRQTQSEKRDKIIREVVDGQQRISAVLDFIEGKYRLARTLQAPWAGKDFGSLTREHQDCITSYAFSVEIFRGISDLEILEIFSRLNTYSVSLNSQELRNGRYFGLFKQSVYALAYEHLEFWRRHKLFTEAAIARMSEVEFVGEAVIAILSGMQDKKKSIDAFYEKYDNEFELKNQTEQRFRDVIDDINETLEDSLVSSSFRRMPLFYTLFCVIVHHRYGLPGVSLPTPRRRLNRDEYYSLREAVATLSESLESAKAKHSYPDAHREFVAACMSQTDNIQPRTQRFNSLYRLSFS
jgi:hypothetical protein